MYDSHDPKWLRFLARRLPWLAIPNIAAVFVGLQIIGYFLVASDPNWFDRLALVPERVLQGEVWRLLTFMALPLTASLIGMLFALMFGYFVLNLVESEWGSFKTTLYVLTSIALTVVFSLVFDYPVASVMGFATTWFLAAATLYPENQIQIYFFIPVKMKFLGWLTLAFVALQVLRGSWLDRLYLLVVYANYFIFFGPHLIYLYRQWKRRREFKAKWR